MPLAIFNSDRVSEEPWKYCVDPPVELSNADDTAVQAVQVVFPQMVRWFSDIRDIRTDRALYAQAAWRAYFGPMRKLVHQIHQHSTQAADFVATAPYMDSYQDLAENSNTKYMVLLRQLGINNAVQVTLAGKIQSWQVPAAPQSSSWDAWNRVKRTLGLESKSDDYSATYVLQQVAKAQTSTTSAPAPQPSSEAIQGLQTVANRLSVPVDPISIMLPRILDQITILLEGKLAPPPRPVADCLPNLLRIAAALGLTDPSKTEPAVVDEIIAAISRLYPPTTLPAAGEFSDLVGDVHFKQAQSSTDVTVVFEKPMRLSIVVGLAFPALGNVTSILQDGNTSGEDFLLRGSARNLIKTVTLTSEVTLANVLATIAADAGVVNPTLVKLYATLLKLSCKYC